MIRLVFGPHALGLIHFVKRTVSFLRAWAADFFGAHLAIGWGSHRGPHLPSIYLDNVAPIAVLPGKLHNAPLFLSNITETLIIPHFLHFCPQLTKITPMPLNFINT